MKISIIMPTYNDSETILETIDTVFDQTYQNWELIIVNDGSTDDTEKKIESYKKKNDKQNKIKYVYQENSDQLKAVIKGGDYIEGDIVFILHSDDLLASSDVFEKVVNHFNNSNVDAIVADLITIDSSGNETGQIKTINIIGNQRIFPLQLLWLGRNIYTDVTFVKTEAFFQEYKKNYLLWNGPFWLSLKNKPEQLIIERVKFPFIKYRLHETNYIKNEIGKLNVLNGELRVVSKLMKNFYLPFYKIQYLVFRVFNKLKLLNYYYPVYLSKETKRKVDIIKFVINKRYPDGYEQYSFLKSLVEYFENYSHDKKLILDFKIEDEIYLGCDVRKFNKNLLENKLPHIYNIFIDEMKKGFSTVEVISEDDKKKVKDILSFLCIDSYVEVVLKGDRK